MANNGVFHTKDYMATEFSTAKDKAAFGNVLVVLVMSGFNQDKFSKRLYQRLSNCFGHIAHYDMYGFWSEWFESKKKQLKWVEYILAHTVCGSPKFTFSDIERDFIKWLASSEVREGLQAEVKGTNRAENLDRLEWLINLYPEDARRLMSEMSERNT